MRSSDLSNAIISTTQVGIVDPSSPRQAKRQAILFCSEVNSAYMYYPEFNQSARFTPPAGRGETMGSRLSEGVPNALFTVWYLIRDTLIISRILRKYAVAKS